MSIDSFYYPKFSTLPDAWEQSSFSEIAELWILSRSQLSLKRIDDLGSVKKSFIASNITQYSNLDTWDWYIAEKSSSKPLVALAYMGIKLFMPPLGCIWHASHGMYYFVQWIRTGEKQPYFNKHIHSLVTDLLYTIAALSLAIATGICVIQFRSSYLQTTKLRKMEFLPSAYYALGSLFFPIVLLSLVQGPIFCTDKSTILISYLIKQHLRRIGQNGWLLTYHQETDSKWLFETLDALRKKVAEKSLDEENLTKYKEISKFQSQLLPSMRLTNFLSLTLWGSSPTEKFKNALNNISISGKPKENYPTEAFFAIEQNILRAKESNNPFVAFNVQLRGDTSLYDILRACHYTHRKSTFEINECLKSTKECTRTRLLPLSGGVELSHALDASLEYVNHLYRNNLINEDFFKECT